MWLLLLLLLLTYGGHYHLFAAALTRDENGAKLGADQPHAWPWWPRPLKQLRPQLADSQGLAGQGWHGGGLQDDLGGSLWGRSRPGHGNLRKRDSGGGVDAI